MNKLCTKYLFLVLILSISFLSSCKKDSAGINNPPAIEPIPNPYSSSHFTFYFTSYDSLTIKATADSVEKHYARILTDLMVNSVSKISVRFYNSYDDLSKGVKHAVPNLPAFTIGLSTAKDTIHMIAPKHPSYNYTNMLKVIVHEFAHCVSLNINPSIANNPRWLWECVAQYESEDFIHPSNLTYMMQQNPPTLSELNSISNTQVYEVGYLISEFIIENWSRQHLKNLILNNGNIYQALGMTVNDFDIVWFQFVKNKYNI